MEGLWEWARLGFRIRENDARHRKACFRNEDRLTVLARMLNYKKRLHMRSAMRWYPDVEDYDTNEQSFCSPGRCSTNSVGRFRNI
jgi:hypothetical protein